MTARLTSRLGIGLAGLVLLAVALPGVAAGDNPLLPTIVPGKGDKCVEPTDVMRRDHMELILHQRDETMHRGIRTSRHSLKECIECHVQTDDQGNYIPVNDPQQFCSSCHSYASVKMDCFQCHATTPEQK